MKRVIRVLYVIDQLKHLGGAERSLLRLLRGLPRDRFSPSVLTFDFNPEAFPGMPCPVLVYPIRRIYGWNGIRYGARFAKLLRAEQIDIVHTFFESSDLWAAPLARLFGNVVLLSSRRDMGLQRHKFHDVAYRVVSPLFDQVQAVSDEVGRYVLRADGLEPSRVVTVPNGVEFNQVKPEPRMEVRKQYGWSESETLIVSVGNVRPVKGFDVLIRTAALVCRECPPARFVIAGKILENDHYQNLLALVAENGLEGRVQFLGGVERVFDLLSASDVFFLPSRSEGMSNALLEAMACGLPAVASRVGGNPELIRDGETGYLVAVEDAEAAADRLLTLISDRDKARAMGKAARTLAESRYSMEATVGMVIHEYERLLGSK